MKCIFWLMAAEGLPYFLSTVRHVQSGVKQKGFITLINIIIY